jgi:crystallin alpha B
MSLLPLLLSTWWTSLDRSSMMDRNLGLAAISPSDELMFPRIYERYYPIADYDRGVLDFYYKPWMDVMRRRTGGSISVGIDKNSFKVIIDVHQFKPEEITVKVIDRCLFIEAKHEETQDEHGSISRQFVRRYQLPERADVDQVTSTISSDGILTITTMLKPKEEKQERIIKIELIGQPALHKDGEDQQPVTEVTTISSTEKKVVENEIREELTTQGQQEDAKPEK